MWVSGIALCTVGNMSRGSFNCQRVGVLLSAGSFSPPTLMHLLSLEQSREYVENTLHHPVWKGFLSPVHDAYQKPGLVAAKHRLQMCALAVKDSDWVQVDAWEAQQPCYSPTFQVVQSLRERLEAQRRLPDPGPSVFLVCGADLVASMNNPSIWPVEHLQKLFALCEVVALPRPALDATDEEAVERVLRQYPAAIHYWKDAPVQCNISSTLVRERVAHGRSIRYLTPRAVENYIWEHGLYRQTNPSIESAQ
jgi:nicotinamide mononucleotide adenylyltransferase